MGMKNLGRSEVDHQAQLFLRAVAADVDEAVGAVVVDDVGVAALEVVDHAVDGLLVAGDDARAEQTTVSPASILANLWLLTAARESADMGSPWVPEISTRSLLVRRVS
jgi:hypothetical protein